jgi:hypothetical protein
VPPIHVRIDDRAWQCIRPGKIERCAQEPGKFLPDHFAGGHGELAMLDSAAAAYVAVDFNVVGRVRERRARLFVRHEEFISRGIKRIAAIDPMLAKQPKVPWPRRGGADCARELIRPIGIICWVERLDAQINLMQNSVSRAAEWKRLTRNSGNPTWRRWHR